MNTTIIDYICAGEAYLLNAQLKSGNLERVQFIILNLLKSLSYNKSCMMYFFFLYFILALPRL